MINKLRFWIPSHLRFLLSCHLILMGIFSLFRYIMLVYNRPSYFFDMERSMTLRQAFKIGFWFDVTIASYAMLLPYIALTYSYFSKRDLERLNKYVRVYCGIAIVVSLVICAADVPYFRYFNARLNVSTIHLKNLGQVAEFIAKEVKYYPVVLLFAFGLWGMGRVIMRLWNQAWKYDNVNSARQKMTATVMASFLLSFGLWGGGAPRVPDMKSATFSNDGFVNLLTLNPVHTWFDSYFEFNINLCSQAEALEVVQDALGITPSKTQKDTVVSPILREHQYKAAPRRMNVVLILMESMSADRMGLFGSTDQLTPGLDRVARNSVLFDRCFSSGIHTNCGIYSSVYGMPSIMMYHPMLNGVSEKTPFSGLPVTLKQAGYRTRFFCSHPKTFDNLDIFLERNGFDKISDQNDYAPEVVANAWGVGDETLLGRALSDLDSMATSADDPFFATVLTITTHPPYTLPKDTKFVPKQTDPVKITYEYADWAISSFIDSCATKDWYDETIFVLVGDHGVNLSSYVNDVPLSYNHIPLIIHAPGIFKKPEVRHGLASQTDIYPTVMGLLQEDYTQNTLGYDLFREKRPYVIFSQDFRMCTLDDNYLHVARKSGKESLYEYNNPQPVDVLDKYPWIGEEMKMFACSHLKTAQWMIGKGMVGPVLGTRY